MVKSCGSCGFWVARGLSILEGMCQKHRVACLSGDGRVCTDWEDVSKPNGEYKNLPVETAPDLDFNELSKRCPWSIINGYCQVTGNGNCIEDKCAVKYWLDAINGKQ